MENPKASVVERLKAANNVLVTVSNNPSVDQLAGAIGLTLLLNKLHKHATAVFSGDVPSTIEFLKPEQTLEKNTDSLRDFIISLDKAKADKLRYKVEEKLVKIFITPYKTSIDQSDLEFSQGDFNVDVVVALGVHEQQEIDQAIIAHGRILHDATIISVNTQTMGSLGSINWVDNHASSLCEMIAELGIALKNDIFDAQNATALLTGIVAETNRFSNEKTTAITMGVSAKLMTAGANQQLVATKLQEKPKPVVPEAVVDDLSGGDQPGGGSSDGSLRIDHSMLEEETGEEPPAPANTSQVHIDEQGNLLNLGEPTAEKHQPEQVTPPPPEPQQAPEPKPEVEPEQGNDSVPDTPKIILTPPTMGSNAAANTVLENVDSDQDGLSLPPVSMPLLSHSDDNKLSASKRPAFDTSSLIPEAPKPAPTVEPPANQKVLQPGIDNDQTLSEIEKAVESPHVGQEELASEAQPDLDAIRNAVNEAVNSGDGSASIDPIIAQGATPVNLDLGHDGKGEEVQPDTTKQEDKSDYLDVTKVDESTGLPKDQPPGGPQNGGESPPDSMSPGVQDPNAPPPVPPPMMPPTMPSMQFNNPPFPNQSSGGPATDTIASI